MIVETWQTPICQATNFIIVFVAVPPSVALVVVVVAVVSRSFHGPHGHVPSIHGSSPPTAIHRAPGVQRDRARCLAQGAGQPPCADAGHPRPALHRTAHVSAAPWPPGHAAPPAEPGNGRRGVV